MLEERTRVISQLTNRPVVQRRMVAADFKCDDLSKILLQHPDFDPCLPTAIIYEGCSMYFSKQENQEILTLLGQTLQNPESRIWSDMVTPDVVDGTTHVEEIAAFVDAMEQLGEKCNFGCNDPSSFMLECGLEKRCDHGGLFRVVILPICLSVYRGRQVISRFLAMQRSLIQ